MSTKYAIRWCDGDWFTASQVLSPTSTRRGWWSTEKKDRARFDTKAEAKKAHKGSGFGAWHFKNEKGWAPLATMVKITTRPRVFGYVVRVKTGQGSNVSYQGLYFCSEPGYPRTAPVWDKREKAIVFETEEKARASTYGKLKECEVLPVRGWVVQGKASAGNEMARGKYHKNEAADWTEQWGPKEKATRYRTKADALSSVYGKSPAVDIVPYEEANILDQVSISFGGVRIDPPYASGQFLVLPSFGTPIIGEAKKKADHLSEQAATNGTESRISAPPAAMYRMSTQCTCSDCKKARGEGPTGWAVVMHDPGGKPIPPVVAGFTAYIGADQQQAKGIHTFATKAEALVVRDFKGSLLGPWKSGVKSGRRLVRVQNGEIRTTWQEWTIRKRYVVQFPTQALAEQSRKVWDRRDEFSAVQEGAVWVVRAKAPETFETYELATKALASAPGGSAMWDIRSVVVQG